MATDQLIQPDIPQPPRFFGTAKHSIEMMGAHGKSLLLSASLLMTLGFLPLVSILEGSLSSLVAVEESQLGLQSLSETAVAEKLAQADVGVFNGILYFLAFILVLHFITAYCYLFFESKSLETGESWIKILIKFSHLRPIRYLFIVTVFTLFLSPLVFLAPPFAVLLGIWPIHLCLYFSSQPRAHLGFTLKNLFTFRFAVNEIGSARLRFFIAIAALSMLSILVHTFILFLYENLESLPRFQELQFALIQKTVFVGPFQFTNGDFFTALVAGTSLGVTSCLIASLFSTFWSAFTGKLFLKTEVEVGQDK